MRFERDMENYQDPGLCYLPNHAISVEVEADNTIFMKTESDKLIVSL